MKDDGIILAIDQGTTSTRALIFDAAGEILGHAQRELPQIYPQHGWVEHEPDLIWRALVSVCRAAIHNAGLQPEQITAAGITNQRETVVVWDRNSGRTLHNAIVWQDRRTADFCHRLAEAGHGEMIQARTGLIIDPYFSASKLKWLLDNDQTVAAAAKAGRLAFGTVDSYLIWHLTGGKVHATDVTNASRTMLFNIHEQRWDDELLALFSIPRDILPEVKESADDFGESRAEILGASIPIRGVAGDQQAALVGQACFEAGELKSTYGTGCFLILNTGAEPVTSRNRLLTTIGYRIQGQTAYALEGSIFVAGAAVKWLRDKLGVIKHAAETETLAEAVRDTGGLYLVPAFAGLGAPYWDPKARGALLGMTLDSDYRDIVRAALESVGYQTADLVRAMVEDGASLPHALKVDGGMVANSWLMQFLADILNLHVDRARITETTAFGAAGLAAIGAGIYQSTDDIRARWALDERFEPKLAPQVRQELCEGWADAVRRVLG